MQNKELCSFLKGLVESEDYTGLDIALNTPNYMVCFSVLEYIVDFGSGDMIRYISGKKYEWKFEGMQFEIPYNFFSWNTIFSLDALFLIRSCELFSGVNRRVELSKLIYNLIDIDNDERELVMNRVLLTASKFSRLDYIQWAIEMGADVDYTNPLGESPLIFASVSDNVDAGAEIQYLIDNGANVNLQTVGGFTAITNAIFSDNVKNAEILLLNGADPRVSAKNKQSALSLSKKKKMLGFITMCRDYGFVL
ncbi:ankyrin repeat domain-containing protein [Armatimonas sp.]|uniref:ankyrin repeat domain-containing protein n=1 Tax=Armatimonas sp. TaxID=1872638 RepID=UPI00374C8B50